jgi:diaminopimelate epimerase
VGLRFHKLHGAGNDFMLVDLRSGMQPGDVTAIDGAAVRAWSDRHTGIGFDQLLALGDGGRPGVDAEVAIWNADGSSAEQCGNGMRAIGLYLARLDGANRNRFLLDTPAGEIPVRFRSDEEVSVAMGSPRWAPDQVPFLGQEAVEDGVYRIMLDGEEIAFGALSMGNPHVVIEVPSAERARLETVGRALQANAAFPESCNVGFAEVLDAGAIRLRVLERGADETPACGSGACAAVAWLARRQRVAGRVRVEQGGGTLWVETDAGAGPVTLTGPAAYVFEGNLA